MHFRHQLGKISICREIFHSICDGEADLLSSLNKYLCILQQLGKVCIWPKRIFKGLKTVSLIKFGIALVKQLGRTVYFVTTKSQYFFPIKANSHTKCNTSPALSVVTKLHCKRTGNDSTVDWIDHCTWLRLMSVEYVQGPTNIPEPVLTSSQRNDIHCTNV